MPRTYSSIEKIRAELSRGSANPLTRTNADAGTRCVASAKVMWAGDVLTLRPRNSGLSAASICVRRAGSMRGAVAKYAGT